MAFYTNDLYTLFRTAECLIGKRSAPNTNIKDEAGVTLMTAEEELKRWERYVQVLFHANEIRPTITYLPSHDYQPAAAIAGLPMHTRRGPGRPRASWVNILIRWSGLSVADLKDAGLHR